MGEKLGYMDGLRGIAAFVVVLHHFACAFFPFLIFGGSHAPHLEIERWISNSPLSLLVAGQFAVCIFFVMSGFVLSYKFFASDRADVIASGAVRRYFRLMPTVLAAVLLSFLVMAVGLYQNTQAAQATGSMEWLAVSWTDTANIIEAVKLGLYDAFVTGNNTVKYDNVLWTMKIEFFGSFLVFAILALFGRLRRRWLVYLLLAILLRHTYYLAFVFGLALCDWVTEQKRQERPVGWPFLGWAAIAEGLALATLPSPRPLVLIIAAGLVLGGLVMVPNLQRFLTLRPLAYLGRVSFSLYLVHLTVLASLGCFVFLKAYPAIGYGSAVALSLVVSLPVIFGLSELLTRYVDAPAIRLSGSLYHRSFARRPKADLESAAVVTEPSASVKMAS